MARITNGSLERNAPGTATVAGWSWADVRRNKPYSSSEVSSTKSQPFATLASATIPGYSDSQVTDWFDTSINKLANAA